MSQYRIPNEKKNKKNEKKKNNNLVLELRYWLLRSDGAEEYRSGPGSADVSLFSASSSSGSCQTLYPSRDLERETKRRHKETATDQTELDLD